MAPRIPAGRRWLATLSVFTLVVACGDATSPEAAVTPSEITVSQDRLRAHVGALAHDSMCGRLVGTPYERQAAEYIADEFASSGLDPSGDEGYFQTVLTGPLPLEAPAATGRCAADPIQLSQNVLGVLAGQGALAAQWVIVGAHYDHMGWEAAEGLARVFNGADDNASGTAMTMEVARQLAAWIAAHPDRAASHRSVMFQAYGAEEIGLFGSRQFALMPTVPADSIYAMVNFDMVGRLRDETLVVAGASTAPGWVSLLEDARPDDLLIVFADGSLDRSDQWSFINWLGVPGLHLFTGTHADYHTPADDPPLLNYGGMQKIARLSLGLVWDLMTLEDGLGGVE